MDRGFSRTVYSFDNRAARHYADITSARRAAGRTITTFDAMIAAIAVSVGADIVTRDVGGFRDCGLQVHNPWDR
jgi:predicted nucleic acid-binding protein